MDHLSDQSCQPSRKLRRGGYQFGLCRLRELGSQDLQSIGSLIRSKPCQSADGLARGLAPKGQLPARRMTQFKDKSAKGGEGAGVATGVAADRREYSTISLQRWRMREIPATMVAFWDVFVARPLPVLGVPEPIFPNKIAYKQIN